MIFQDAYVAAQCLLDSTVRMTHNLEIVIGECIEYPNAWVFGYNTRRFLEDHDLMSSMVGNGPVVVLKDGSRQPFLGDTSCPIGEQIEGL
ncbi:YrhB domain-containing protein [Actinocatenispora thailandica]|uniref:YrhB domain-containing protein n=1 Tax=Actinocatenispora thailandica TaxID=227318 RepID=UPI00194FACA8|nr:YrhB domain-containing protein [Actinocatenispora thailandica]